jgi:ribulose-phosphate 3-epimerase
MNVIPVINCTEFDCVKSRIMIAQDFLCDPGSSHRSGAHEGWVHIDIADGGFTHGYSTWRNPSDLQQVKRNPNLKIEAHIMLNEPELALESWLAAGVNRIIVHLETVTSLDTVVNICTEKNVEVWLAVTPSTPVEKMFPYIPLVKGCQILAVNPGLPGQVMEPGMLQKISTLRQAFPALPIEVDGGITAVTIPQCKAAGATVVVAGSAIFNTENPATIYHSLTNTT